MLERLHSFFMNLLNEQPQQVRAVDVALCLGDEVVCADTISIAFRAISPAFPHFYISSFYGKSPTSVGLFPQTATSRIPFGGSGSFYGEEYLQASERGKAAK
ncbi:hypothetical protein [Agathobaculum sp. TL06]